jgi:arylsulfatase A-like enzyme
MLFTYKNICTFVFFFLLLLIPQIGKAQAAYSIKGTVRNAQNLPITNATVLLEGTFFAVRSDKNGNFAFSNLAPDEYQLAVSMLGLETFRQVISLKSGEVTDLQVVLKPNLYFAKQITNFKPIEPTHLPQKEAYLNSVKKIDGSSPNIILVFFDDLGYGDLGCYGSQMIQTPTIDKLAKEGVQMNQFYSASPVCTPSRAALLTGRYPVRSHTHKHVFFPEGSPTANLRKVRGSENFIPKDEILLPEILQKAGYQTAMVGKWHLGDKQGHLPNDFGFEQYFGLHYSHDMNPLNIYRNGQIEIEAKNLEINKLTELYTQEAVKAINTKGEKPLFLYIAHNAPHEPHFSPNEGKSKAGIYGDMVEDLDRSMAIIMEALKRTKQDKNTIILITSDNGGDYGGSVGNLRGRKGETFEGGMRVPLIVWGKGKLKPHRSEAMAMNIDIVPSLLDMLQIQLPTDREIDGKSLKNVWNKKENTPHTQLFYFSAWTGELRAVRVGNLKYHERQQKLMENSFFPMPPLVTLFAESALYDMVNDNESFDLSKKYPETVRKMQQRLEEMQTNLRTNQRGWK